uniref:Uncharacterized protein n=1 Tax=Arundo donax TaxID=35708 RepID=A0A0A9E509_ARUDO
MGSTLLFCSRLIWIIFFCFRNNSYRLLNRTIIIRISVADTPTFTQ